MNTKLLNWSNLLKNRNWLRESLGKFGLVDDARHLKQRKKEIVCCFNCYKSLLYLIVNDDDDEADDNFIGLAVISRKLLP